MKQIKNIIAKWLISELLYSCAAPTAKSCEPCGTYMIPYPLSTGPNCGDPMYKFNCNSTGQLNFMMPDGIPYPVKMINEDARKFYIQTDGSYSCSSPYQNDKANFPFKIAACLPDELIEINWLPAPEPPCSEFIDCNNWPHSKCKATSEGRTRCLCDSNYKWNSSSINCTQG